MLFEIRDRVPDVSEPWVESRDRFLEGKVRAARDLSLALKGTKPQRAEDYVLLIEIARACGKLKPYLALVRRAMKVFPDDPFVRLYWSRALLTRGRHLQAIRDLEGLETTLGKTMPGTWTSQLGNLWADCGFEQSSRKWMDRAQAYPAEFDSPLGLYTRACAAEGLRQWGESADLGRRLVDAAPNWTRARSLVIHCLLAQGRIEEAQEMVADGQKLGHEEAYFEFEAAMLDFSLGRFDQAHEAFDAMRERWPEADFAPYVRRTLCILLIEAGRVDEARALAAGEEEKFGLPTIGEGVVNGRRAFLPMPLIAQAKNQCVPCVTAMALWPRGKRIDPEQAFREMKGREGTSLWRMRAWAKEQGLACVAIRLDAEATRVLLDRGVPLIGTLEGLFNSHVDVICGYHEGLKTFYVRDPMHWAPLAFPEDLTFERYRLHGATLALVDENDAETLVIARSYRSDEGQALLDLHQATAEGNREAADAAYARIPDGSECDYLRDVIGMHVAISPSRFAESVERWAKPEEKRGLVRFRALLSRSGDDLDAFLRDIDDEERERLGEGGRRYLRMMSQVRLGEWRDSLRRIDAMLETGCGSPDLWELRSDVLAELGDEAGSREALDRALELEPLRMRLREKLLNRTADRLTFAEYLQEFDRLLADDPDDKRLLAARSYALADGPEGKTYESAMRDVIKWFPRDPQNYGRLMGWYSIQDRPDLENRLLAEARALMPQEFPDPAAAEAAASDGSVGVGAATKEEIRVAEDAAERMKELEEAVGKASAEASRSTAPKETPRYGEEATADSPDTLAASGLDVHTSDVPAGRVVAPPPALSEPPSVEAVSVEGSGVAPSTQDQAAVAAIPVDENALPTDKQELLAITGQANDPRRDQALKALTSLEQDGKLLWHERARLMVARVLRFGGESWRTVEDIQALFPLPTPGAPNWFVGYSYSLLTDATPPPAPRAAVAAIRWGEKAIDDYRAHVAIWFDRVLLFEKAHDLERARKELEELLTKYPAHSSALYRMGVIEQQQGDLASALAFFDRALKVNPGLYGALRLRKQVLEQLDRRDEAVDAARALLTKFPYSMQSLKDLASAAVVAKDAKAGIKILDDLKADFDPVEVALYRARLSLYAGNREEAERTLATVADPSSLRDDAFEDFLRTRLQIADADQDHQAAFAAIELGIARFPDSTVLREMLGARRAAAKNDPAEARFPLEWVLLEGEPRYETVYQYLETFPSRRSATAIGTIARAKEDRQPMLVNLFSVVMASAYLQEAEEFHEWALKKFPNDEGLRSRYVVHLDLLQKYDRAIDLAEQGLEQQPDDPNAKRLLGRVLIAKDAERSVKLLQEACAMNRDVDTLFDLARAYSMMRLSADALATYREILDQNPYQAASWTNLFLLNEPAEKLFAYLEPMFSRGVGADDEYFLVAAVQLALKMKTQLPASWYPVALRRREVLQTMPGYRDERNELKKAMLAWEAKRPQDLAGNEPTPGSWWEKLLARWKWPGTKWIPKE